MTKIHIPENFIPGFEVLAKLQFDEIEALAKLIKEMPVGIGPKVFHERLVENINYQGIDQISQTLFSVGPLVATYEEDTDDLAKELAESYSLIKQDLDNESKIDFIKKLNLLFKSYSSLKLTFKAINLLSENDKVFREGRIITDIRLVFNDSLEEKRRNATIVHRMKLEYYKNGEYKEFFLSLDRSDLTKLRDQIDRALNKEQLIKDNYKHEIHFIDLMD